MSSPPPARIRLSADQRRARNVREGCHLTIAQGRIDVLPFPRPGPLDQSRHDGIRRIQTSRQIRHGDTDLDGRPMSGTRNVHQTHLGLDHDVVPSLLAVGTRLSVSGNAGVDDTRIKPGHCRIVEIVSLQGIGDEVLDEDVAASDHAMQDVNPGRMCE